MSHKASISITLHRPVPFRDLLSAWMASYWSLGRQYVSYLPLGDNGKFDWQSERVDAWPRIQEILEAKEQRQEIAGLTLRVRDTDIHASFLLYPDGTSSILPDADRPRLPGAEECTDMTWFLTRLVPPLIAAGYPTRVVECRDCD